MNLLRWVGLAAAVIIVGSVWEWILEDAQRLSVVVGALVFAGGLAALRRQRLFEETPTSRVRSMSVGAVELEGQADAEPSLVAPLSGEPCVYFAVAVKIEDSEGRWFTVAGASSKEWPLRFVGPTGSAWIDVRGASSVRCAESSSAKVRSLPDGVRQLVELIEVGEMQVEEVRIAPGSPLFLHGVALTETQAAPARKHWASLVAARQELEELAQGEAPGEVTLPRALRREVARRVAEEKAALRKRGKPPLGMAELEELRVRVADGVRERNAQEAADRLATAQHLERARSGAFKPKGLGRASVGVCCHVRAAAVAPRIEADMVVGADPLEQKRLAIQNQTQARIIESNRSCARWGLALGALWVPLALSSSFLAKWCLGIGFAWVFSMAVFEAVRVSLRQKRSRNGPR